MAFSPVVFHLVYSMVDNPIFGIVQLWREFNSNKIFLYSLDYPHSPDFFSNSLTKSVQIVDRTTDL